MLAKVARLYGWLIHGLGWPSYAAFNPNLAHICLLAPLLHKFELVCQKIYKRRVCGLSRGQHEPFEPIQGQRNIA